MARVVVGILLLAFSSMLLVGNVVGLIEGTALEETSAVQCVLLIAGSAALCLFSLLLIVLGVRAMNRRVRLSPIQVKRIGFVPVGVYSKPVMALHEARTADQEIIHNLTVEGIRDLLLSHKLASTDSVRCQYPLKREDESEERSEPPGWTPDAGWEPINGPFSRKYPDIDIALHPVAARRRRAGQTGALAGSALAAILVAVATARTFLIDLDKMGHPLAREDWIAFGAVLLVVGRINDTILAVYGRQDHSRYNPGLWRSWLINVAGFLVAGAVLTPCARLTVGWKLITGSVLALPYLGILAGITSGVYFVFAQMALVGFLLGGAAGYLIGYVWEMIAGHWGN